ARHHDGIDPTISTLVCTMSREQRHHSTKSRPQATPIVWQLTQALRAYIAEHG
ncbi:MAG: hypothetical protein QOC79_1872, partial [Actinomycetota bacterium]|nr:hypothetical protein [Actinomycetota bacterium]